MSSLLVFLWFCDSVIWSSLLLSNYSSYSANIFLSFRKDLSRNLDRSRFCRYQSKINPVDNRTCKSIVRPGWTEESTREEIDVEFTLWLPSWPFTCSSFVCVINLPLYRIIHRDGPNKNLRNTQGNRIARLQRLFSTQKTFFYDLRKISSLRELRSNSFKDQLTKN